MVADASPYIAAGFGLVGTLIGGGITGTVSLCVAREARRTAERAWMRDSRREIYDRLLTTAQSLHLACEEAARCGRGSAIDAVGGAFSEFLKAYSVVQTVAQRSVIDAARVYTYRLIELRDVLDSTGMVGVERLGEVASLVRDARHDTIDAMRADLGLCDTARPPDPFNPFAGTELAAVWKPARDRGDDPDDLARTWAGTPRR